MFIDTRHRTDEAEALDDFAMEGEILRDALDKIAKINQFLGGNRLTLNGLRQLLAKQSEKEKISIVDVGCGNGDMLRAIADYGIKNNLNFDLIGVDANNFTINHARQLSNNYNNIHYVCEDIFDREFAKRKYDIVLCTLTLHHFKEPEILTLLSVFDANSRIGIVVNDLQRSAVAYRLFQALCFTFGLNDLSREDGLISILRGFKRNELVNFSKKLKFSNYKIHWKWAFRYQWIISKV